MLPRHNRPTLKIPFKVVRMRVHMSTRSNTHIVQLGHQVVDEFDADVAAGWFPVMARVAHLLENTVPDGRDLNVYISGSFNDSVSSDRFTRFDSPYSNISNTVANLYKEGKLERDERGVPVIHLIFHKHHRVLSRF